MTRDEASESSSEVSSVDEDFAAFLSTPPSSPSRGAKEQMTDDVVAPPSAQPPEPEEAAARDDEGFLAPKKKDSGHGSGRTTMETQGTGYSNGNNNNSGRAIDDAVAIVAVENNINGNISNNNNNKGMNNDDDDSEDEEEDDPPHHKWMLLASTLLFVVASILYLVMSVKDYQWAVTLNTLPMDVRTADDDITWINYKLEEEQQQAAAAAALGGGAGGGAGVRRMKTREYWRLREEERERQAEEAALEMIVASTLAGSYEKKVQRKEEEGVVEEVAAQEGEAVPSLGKAKQPVRALGSSQGKPRTAKALKRAAQALPQSWESKTTDTAKAALHSTTGLRRSLQRNLQTPEELGYYDECFDDLPSAIQDAYGTLGYTANIWDNGLEVASSELGWDELSDDEREAALFIGYTEEQWCAETGMPTTTPAVVVVVTPDPTNRPTNRPVTPNPTKEPTKRPVTPNPTNEPTKKPVTPSPTKKPTLMPILVETPTALYWNEIPTDIQQLYVSLGYDEQSWNNGEKVAIDDKTWDNMEMTERLTLFSIGFTRETWDGVGLGEHFSYQPDGTNPPAAAAVPIRYWHQIDPEVQGVYSNLGYNSVIWNTGGKVPIDDKVWSEMTLGERIALASIGVSQEEWDAAGPGEHFPQQPVAVVATPDPTPDPTRQPTPEPTDAPSVRPTLLPTNAPTPSPSDAPSTYAPNTAKPTTMAPTTAKPTTPTTILAEVPAVVPTETAPAAPIPTGPTPEELYYDEYWKDLPPDIQAAYATLGYNETAWNGAIEPPSNDLYWDELSPELQEAASFIGYYEELWNFDPDAPVVIEPTVDEPTVNGSTTVNDTIASKPDLAPAPDDSVFAGFFPDNTTEDKTGPAEEDTEAVVEAGYYDDYGWAELPPEAQEAAGALGYDADLWDMGGLAWSDEFWWDELTPEARAAAAILGYNEESWNNGGDPAADYVSADDDYVFQVGNSDVWVSQYQIIYFFAALSFVFTGFLDLFREKHWFHILMILAGFFGLLSSIYVEYNVYYSNIFSSVSVHFFVFEALTLFGEHNARRESARDVPNWMKNLAMLGDLEFVLGALIDVVLSYFYLLDDTADWDVPIMVSAIFAAVMWLHCSLIYLVFFFVYPEAKPVAPTKHHESFD